MTEEPQGLTLFARVLPHQIITFVLARFAGRSAAEIAALSDLPLQTLRQRIPQTPPQTGAPATLRDPWIPWLDQTLPRTVGDVIRDERVRLKYNALSERHADVLERVVGETTLRDYYRNAPETDIQRWIDRVEQVSLVDRALAGEERAFNALYASCERQVLGFLRARANNDEDAAEIAAETWIKVWEKLSDYDPALASFATFAKNHACYQWKAFYRQAKDDSSGNDPGDDKPRGDDKDLGIPPEQADVYEYLLRVTFGSNLPPHQLIAFGFVRLLEWKPGEVAAELSDVVLRELAKRLERDYLAISTLSEDRLRSHFSPLQAKMARTFGTVVQDTNTLKTYPHLVARVIGDTTLGNYFKSDDEIKQADYIVKWRFSVERWLKKRIQSWLGGNNPAVD